MTEDLTRLMTGLTRSHTDAQPLDTDRVGAALAELPDLERSILKARFGVTDGEPKLLHDLAADYDLTAHRVLQVEMMALRRLRSRLRT